VRGYFAVRLTQQITAMRTDQPLVAATPEVSMSSMAFWLHFSDSILPVGAYAHSFGLEGMISLEQIQDITELRVFFLKDVWHNLANTELQIVSASHAAVKNHQLEKIASFDQLSQALRPTKSQRNASATIGKKVFQLYEATWQSGESVLCETLYKHFHMPVVIGTIFAEQGVSERDCLLSICFQTYSALLQASLKLLPCGPREINQILADTMQEISHRFAVWKAEDTASWGYSMPVWDIASACHEQAKHRLFIT